MTIDERFAQAVLLHQAGRLEEAVRFYQSILAEDPDHFGALANLGQIYRAEKRFDEAIAVFRHALQQQPDRAAVLNGLGLAFGESGRHAEAVDAFRQSARIQPNSAEIHRNLAKVLIDQGDFAEAVAACHRALQLKPRFPEAWNNLGTALAELGQLDSSVAAYHRALQLNPRYPEAHSNLGTVLQEQGRLQEATQAYRRAVQFQSDFSEARLNYALMLLLHGDYEHGWPLYESRWDAFGYGERKFSQPRWDGCPLAGRTVLLHAEQGLGDTLQFIRYAPLVARAGGRVVVECQPGLQRLLQNVEGISQILVSGEALPSFDLHCPLMSLPLAFGTKIETIPREIPYLQADPEKAALWRKRLKSEVEKLAAGQPSSETMLKVGLVWAGGSRPHQRGANRIDQRRSISLAQFAALAEVSGVLLVSLQKGPPAEQALAGPRGLRLLDWTTDLEDFADTAALIEALDLVISVDTAVVHLAGALGKPVWMLNRFDTCWRWLLNRTDSPWYPTLRLFRQPRLGDWGPVISQVCKELEQVGKSRP